MFNSFQCLSPDFPPPVCHPRTCLLHSSITYESFQRNFFKIMVYFMTLYAGTTFTFEEQLGRMQKSLVLIFPFNLQGYCSLMLGHLLFERSVGPSYLFLLLCLKHSLCLEFANVIRLVCCCCVAFVINLLGTLLISQSQNTDF